MYKENNLENKYITTVQQIISTHFDKIMHTKSKKVNIRSFKIYSVHVLSKMSRINYEDACLKKNVFRSFLKCPESCCFLR